MNFCSVNLRVIDILAIVSMVGMKLSTPIYTTSTHMVVGMLLTAKTGPHTGSYSGLYKPDPGGRHFFDG